MNGALTSKQGSILMAVYLSYCNALKFLLRMANTFISAVPKVRHSDKVRNIEADRLWAGNLIYDTDFNFNYTTNGNLNIDVLESLSTDGNWTVVDTSTLLAIPKVTKIKYFHQISETRLVIIASMANCLHVYDRNFSGLSVVVIIGNCKADGFVDGVDPLFKHLPSYP